MVDSHNAVFTQHVGQLLFGAAICQAEGEAAQSLRVDHQRPEQRGTPHAARCTSENRDAH